tara:strand:+ start:239 stop:607 length:369 start_codon:yes stop_codon:yes gene_type:complete
MANGIYFGSSEMDDLKFGGSQVDKIYLGDVLVWSLAGEFIAGSISNVGDINITAGTYPATQFSTSGSGSGATFNVTISASEECTAFTVTNGGSGYAASDTVTLDVTGLIPSLQNPRIELTSA